MATVTIDSPETRTHPAEPAGRYEVVGDRILEKPPMGAFEYDLAFLLGVKIEVFAEAHGLGRAFVEMLFDLRPAVDRQRRPDVAFVSAQKWPIHRRAPRLAAWAMVPDLAIEIISPTNSASEVRGKTDEYFAAGCRLVWVVYPDQSQVLVHESATSARVLKLGDELDGGDVVPEFRLGLADLFGETPA